MSEHTLDTRSDRQNEVARAIETAKRFVTTRFPSASLAMLCGSWARGVAHADSDLDLIVVDPQPDGGVVFEGLMFES